LSFQGIADPVFDCCGVVGGWKVVAATGLVAARESIAFA
jgi:hypothetical protein